MSDNLANSVIKSSADGGFADQLQHAHNLALAGQLDSSRCDAVTALINNDLPGQGRDNRVEQFKYTDLKRLLQHLPDVNRAKPVITDKQRILDKLPTKNMAKVARLVIVNGYFCPELSDTDLINDYINASTQFTPALAIAPPTAATSKQQLTRADTLVALNLAFYDQSLVINIPPATELDFTIELANIITATDGGEPFSAGSRVKIMLGDDAKANILQTFVGDDELAYHNNNYLELSVGDRARLHMYHCQMTGKRAVHLDRCNLIVGQDSEIKHMQFSAGGLNARSEMKVAFTGKNANADFIGCALAANGQRIDILNQLSHVAGGCNSHQTFKTVVGQSASSSFQGQIIVFPDAQQTDSGLMARGLLLADDSEFNSKPELEIFADDVQCGHGSTTGKPDHDQIHYLMTRGIPEHQAQKLVTMGFITSAFSDISDDNMREMFGDIAHNWGENLYNSNS